jgi:DNA (cytosine-5)-methyltransferase 1
MRKHTFYEFFAGGGMARAGLGADWQCLFANDFDVKKVEAYKANWGSDEIVCGDIHKLAVSALPGQADLAWASFPCQDLSLAGNGAGLKGERSGAFWGFWQLINGLKAERRAPKILVLENVTGALTSNGGKDFEELCRALHALNYRFGALVIDAVHFVPQSRPRLFIVAVRGDVEVSCELIEELPADLWASAALKRAHSSLPPHLRAAWRWWRLPLPANSNTTLGNLIEANPSDVKWHTPEETARLVSMMSAPSLAKLEAAKKSGAKAVGTIYRRTRADESGDKRQRAELRFDGIAGCLRTPGGGSSRQFVMVVQGESVRSRLLSGREAARLMGLPDEFKLPENYNETYHLLGDGLAVPVVAFLADNLLRRLFVWDSSGSHRIAAE